MKYTKEQAKHLKDKRMNGYTKYIRYWIPTIIHNGQYYIIESKINNPFLK